MNTDIILVKGFTNKYKIEKLVYFEETNDIYAAISREKQIKGWLRKKKIALIESMGIQDGRTYLNNPLRFFAAFGGSE